MNLLMISGDRSILQRRQGAFWYTLQELRKHWERIDVICPVVTEARKKRGAHSPDDEASFAGGNVFFHPCPWHLGWQILWILRRGRALIAQHGHDVMTVHEYPPFYNGIGARLLAWRTGIPYALEVHHIVGSPVASSFVERVGAILSRLYLPFDAKGARAVRAVNAGVKNQLVCWGIPEQKIQVIPSFYLDRAILAQNHRPPVAYDVSFCARLVPNKGLRELIEAARLLDSLRVLIIGDGPERAKCEALVRAYGMEERVTFTGWLPTLNAVVSAIRTAHIFVMNSRSEGGPRSALEAMACGMPVLTTRVGVMPEVVQDGVNGLFTTGEPEDIVQKVQMLLQDQAQRDMLGTNARTVLDRFDRPVLVAQYAHFLQSLA